MADISYSVNASWNKGYLSGSFSASSTSDMKTAAALQVSLQLSTATQQVTTITMNTLGLSVLRSLVTTTIATHTVSFGRLVSNTLYESVRLRPGESAVLRLADGNYAAKAAVAGSGFTITILED